MAADREKMCCKKQIRSSDKIIVCSGVCKRKFHAHCAQVDDTLYEALRNNRNVIYQCEECRSSLSVGDMFRQVMNSMNAMRDENLIFKNEIMSRVTMIEGVLEVSGKTVIDEIKKIDDEVRKVDEKIDDNKWVEVKNKKKNKNQRKSTVIVTPRVKATSREQLRKSLKERINSDDFDIAGISNAPSNGVAITCDDPEKCNKLINEIENKMPQEVSVSMPKILNPRVKVLRLHDADEDDNKLAEILKDKNPSLEGAELKIIKREDVKINGRIIENVSNVIIEVSPKIHKEIMSAGKLKHVWEIVRVVDHVHVKRCYNCVAYNHNASVCRNETHCGKCSENHKTSECNSNIEKCINCVRANARMHSTGHTKFSIDVNHSAWSNKCESYRRKVEHCKKAVNTID